MGGRVQISEQGAALCLTLDNPGRRNALSVVLLNALKAHLAAPLPTGARMVFIRGAGQVFSAGADLNDISGTAKDADYDRLTAEIGHLIRACPLPVAAVIEGPCMGAAVELALSADLRICTKDAYFQVPATRLGLLYKPDAIAALRARFSAETLTRLMVLGERFPAKSARRAGLVGEVIKPERIDARIGELAELAARTDPAASMLTKQLLGELESGKVDMQAWRERYLQILSSESRQAGFRAIKDRLGAKGSGLAPEKTENTDEVQ